MYEFWYDYLNRKYGENLKLCYMDTDSLIAHVALQKILKKGCDTSNFEIDRQTVSQKNVKVIVLMKDKLGGQIMKKIVGLKAKGQIMKKIVRLKAKNISLFRRKQ